MEMIECARHGTFPHSEARCPGCAIIDDEVAARTSAMLEDEVTAAMTKCRTRIIGEVAELDRELHESEIAAKREFDAHQLLEPVKPLDRGLFAILSRQQELATFEKAHEEWAATEADLKKKIRALESERKHFEAGRNARHNEEAMERRFEVDFPEIAAFRDERRRILKSHEDTLGHALVEINELLQPKNASIKIQHRWANKHKAEYSGVLIGAVVVLGTRYGRLLVNDKADPMEIVLIRWFDELSSAMQRKITIFNGKKEKLEFSAEFGPPNPVTLHVPGEE